MPDKLPQPESQKQRWIKYGANVVLASVVVIILAVILTYLAQRTNRRLDTTSAGLYSLKPQTINIIKDIKQPVKLVSLYSPVAGAANDAQRRDAEQHVMRTQMVADLLDEYQRKGKNIEVEIIDPVKQEPKVAALIDEAVKKYGGELAPYRALIDSFESAYTKIENLASEEAAKIAKLPVQDIPQDESTKQLGAALDAPQGTFPSLLSNSRQIIKRRLSDRPPNYKLAAESIDSTMSRITGDAATIVEILAIAKDNANVPAAIRQYIAGSGPAFAQIKKTADELLAKTKNLGSTEKLDDFREKLRDRDAILVFGPNDMRSLSFDQVWKQNDEELRQMASTSGAEVRPRFAGEQQITTAILSLTTEKKPKVAFVRSGGPPLTEAGFPPFVEGGAFSRIAERLREYNFEVLEKDLSGTWAMQAQMRGQPAAPEPTDEEIKDAVWIVLSVPQQQDPRRGPPPPSMAPQVAAHLKSGGGVLATFFPNSDPLSEAFKEWGIEVDTSAVIVHELVKPTGTSSGDFIEEAQRSPPIILINAYGDHVLTKPVQSLDALLFPMLPVKSNQQTPGVKVTPLIPIPSPPKIWAERDVQKALQSNDVSFDEKTDILPPLFAGAAAEKTNGKGRLVVIGSLGFMTNQMLRLPDPDLMARGIPAARFPGNAELVANSVFWLANMETLIAISPSAMEVSRISPMSDTAQTGWRVGALLIGLPGAVIAAGLIVYFARRD